SFAAYRRLLLSFLSMIPVAFGGLLALGFCAFFSDEMSAIIASFGGVLIGIAVDYAVYVLYRYDHFEGPFGDAEKLSRHLSVITSPIVMGAGTTIAAFLCLLLSSLPGQRQLGVFAAVGIGGAALFSLVVLPQMLSLSPPRRKKPLLPLADLWGKFFEWHRGHAGLCWAFVAALSLGALMGISRVRFDGDLKKLSAMSPQTRADEEVITEQWGGQFFDKTLIAVRGATLEEAQQKNDSLYSILLGLQGSGKIGNFNSLSPLAPSQRTQAENAQRWRAFWDSGNAARARGGLAQAGRREGFSPSAFSPFYRAIRQRGGPFPAQALREGALGELARGYVSEQKGETLILTEVQAGSGFDAMAKQVLGEMPDALVYNGDAFSKRISSLVVKVLWRFTWASLAASLAILLLGYGRLEIILVVAAVLGLDTFWSLGLLGWLGVPVNLMNNIFILFIFGMCADYAIYVVSAFLSLYADPGEDIGVAGGAAALSALTTIGAFGTLVLARHPALRSIGISATIVMVIGLLTAAVALPLAMRLLLWKDGRQGTPTLRTLACGVTAIGFFASALVVCRIAFIPWIRLRHSGNPAARRKAMQAFFRASTRLLLGSLPYGKRVFLNAGPQAFGKPAVIVCNHQSVIDIISALNLPADIRMVVKPWVWNSFFIGPAIREAGYILADGENTEEVLEKSRECLEEGDFLLFFPEGSRSETGRIGRYKKGAFEAAVKTNSEILPVVMCETRSCIPKSGFWIGDHRMVVSVLPRIPVGGRESDELAREARNLMAREYEKALVIACAGPEFFKRIRARYHYLGPEVERQVARRLRHDPLCREITGLIPREAVVLDLAEDYGLLANLLAAESTRRSITGFAPDPAMVAVARKAAIAPERMTYELREKRAGGAFPPADAVLLSLDASGSLLESEALLAQAHHSLKRGGPLLLREISGMTGENRGRMLEKAGFFEIKHFGDAILCEKRKDSPNGL
ncbi:MAG TPA: 1-acyl-sn-glycerol-3-phosphate acyltransferase, partial [bacterium]|nr:1-acyl-sn-glycerol-3-phosphate acyltransferase [bacterium]